MKNDRNYRDVMRDDYVLYVSVRCVGPMTSWNRSASLRISWKLIVSEADSIADYDDHPINEIVEVVKKSYCCC